MTIKLSPGLSPVAHSLRSVQGTGAPGPGTIAGHQSLTESAAPRPASLHLAAAAVGRGGCYTRNRTPAGVAVDNRGSWGPC